MTFYLLDRFTVAYLSHPIMYKNICQLVVTIELIFLSGVSNMFSYMTLESHGIHICIIGRLFRESTSKMDTLIPLAWVARNGLVGTQNIDSDNRESSFSCWCLYIIYAIPSFQNCKDQELVYWSYFMPSDKIATRASRHYADGCLIARSRKVSKLRDSGLDLCNRSEIWEAPRQCCCRDGCQFQSDSIIITSNLVASRLHEILWQDFRPLSE